ncbi:MAG: DUF1028 domain-containing protein [Candidatus Eisenbacteria bacterium]|uniref:DUF1028 domain-containing protein n=1 Tax=Eiseniibacteriota bacterium TaxID=2212470 RepID=A0A956LZK5_UNCEI|nr:DUF1028 domain-containing protein [Candidatus Eisenbacteria bacterium]
MRQLLALTLVTYALSLVSVRDAAATFSICAVDLETGEVGSAGASCISGSIILSDVHPGVGVVHTQSYYNSQNQQYARTLMNQGYAPAAIIDSLVAHDAQGNPGIRQYGVVDLVDGGRSAAFTGSSCIDWKGHLTGMTYSTQGNILLGPEVIGDMEAAFVSTDGTLADRLMAALQAAKRPMADTRCTNKSAISAFLRVGRPGDPTNDLYLDLNVNNTSGSTDPIDVLQGLYDDWKATSDVPEVTADPSVFLRAPSPNPFSGSTEIHFDLPQTADVTLEVIDPQGRRCAVLASGTRNAGTHTVTWSADVLPSGVYLLRLASSGVVRERKLVHLPR